MRVGGHLEKALLPFESRHQSLLPNDLHLAKLIIEIHHDSSGHSGTNYVLASTHRKFWIIKGRAAFSEVGIDYFGPLTVHQGCSHVKHYGCIFTCLQSRAVHLEIAHSLESDSFLGALQRFISRRDKSSNHIQ